MSARILVVEDEERIRVFLQRGLGFEGYEVETAPDGKKALEMALNRPPDLVLLDIMLPEMSGIEFLRKLREQGSSVTFGFITSESGHDIKQLAMDTGAQFIITKPFTADSLNAALSPCLA